MDVVTLAMMKKQLPYYLDINPYLGEYADMQESLVRVAQIEKKDLETILAGLQTGRILGLSRTFYTKEMETYATEHIPFTFIQASSFMSLGYFNHNGVAYVFGAAEEDGVCSIMIETL